MNQFCKEQALDIIDQLLEALDEWDDCVLEIEEFRDKNLLTQMAEKSVDKLSISMLKFCGAREDLLTLKQIIECF